MNSILMMGLLVFITIVLAMAESVWWLLLTPPFAGRMLMLTFR